MLTRGVLHRGGKISIPPVKRCTCGQEYTSHTAWAACMKGHQIHAYPVVTHDHHL